ncbi:hypothetical protein [Streptomyces alfalfae]|nr:hypothetical protein [Streptomyces alfalfae]
MALRKDMPIRDSERVPDADKHATDYRSSQGGWVKDNEKPVPGTPKR